jgi:hypothetical protein
MVKDIDTQAEIYDRLQDRLTGQTPELTNFVDGSLNEVIFNRGFSRYWSREFEYAVLASQLSGWIEYAGGPLTDGDLVELGLDPTTIDVGHLNGFLPDQQLDELAAINGVSRDPGDRAIGEVLFTTTSDAVRIDAGTRVSTPPGSTTRTGTGLGFSTTDAVQPDPGTTTVLAPIEAEAVGDEYNVGSGQITHLPSNSPGVVDVTNPEATHEGQDEESNAELRTRAKQAPLATSGGGTTAGIRGFIVETVDGVEEGDVILDEFYDPAGRSPYVDVIADGGTQTAVEDAIASAHSSGIEHLLVRPTIVTLDVSTDVETTGDVDAAAVENVIADHISDRGLGETLYRDRLIRDVMESDTDILNLADLTITVRNEPHTFDSTVDVYTLVAIAEDDGITEVTGTAGGTNTTFVEDTDYQEGDQGGDGHPDAIDWSLAGTDPDDATEFYVDYVVYEDVPIDTREKPTSGTVTATLV